MKYGTKPVFFCAAGALAASYLNSQPWMFEVSKNKILVFADMARWTGEADPDATQLFMSVGCAIKNIEIAATAHGYRVETRIILDKNT